MPNSCYSVYGALVSSDIELPELDRAAGTPEISIRMAAVAPRLDVPAVNAGWFETDGRSVLIRAPGVARYLVKNGNEIEVEIENSDIDNQAMPVAAADVRLFLLGSALGALLHQRAWLPLHVSAVKARRGVWAFTGASGAGKSTLAAWLHRNLGFMLISDDVSVIRPHGAEHIVYPGPRKMKLWQDAVDYLGCGDLDLVRDLSQTEKYQLYLSGSAPACSARLHALVLLEECTDGAAPSLQRLTGGDAFSLCKQAVYRPEFARLVRDPGELMGQLAALCRDVRMYRFSRRKSYADFAEEHALLLEAMEYEAGDTGNTSCGRDGA